MELLVELGIARELTGKRRNRLFVYDRYLAILNEGTEPPLNLQAHCRNRAGTVPGFSGQTGFKRDNLGRRLIAINPEDHCR